MSSGPGRLTCAAKLLRLSGLGGFRRPRQSLEVYERGSGQLGSTITRRIHLGLFGWFPASRA